MKLTHMEGCPDFFIENHDEPIKSSEEKQNDNKSICHNLVTSLDSFIVFFQFLGSNMNVVFTSTLR